MEILEPVILWQGPTAILYPFSTAYPQNCMVHTFSIFFHDGLPPKLLFIRMTLRKQPLSLRQPFRFSPCHLIFVMLGPPFIVTWILSVVMFLSYLFVWMILFWPYFHFFWKGTRFSPTSCLLSSWSFISLLRWKLLLLSVLGLPWL